ncbi:MAG: hypothetical protein A3A33_02675 [Candidatus Yanofskybacteria bacterium RIFCSPLOWO2_01_FULL_49_25]|uniref:VTT domain-containing protein n=1 Tax=Candidatus Yanofskybacteria bacterium RIFCSPLOWO2_01_FULL_49_25 TaxID=1802701 RepID=A0A1F8GUN4_9BACT|nr:MAG: hypothetical protein A3A33_02675 [Candidatus Yanofskybacteria bacterium RIFCSPLOWO2_01_FULL_49_25]
MTHLIESFAQWGVNLISHWGYLGIFVSQAFESALIPIPSEVVVPFGGYLASQGILNLWLVALVATIANTIGGVVVYGIGREGGRPFIERYGKYFLIRDSDITKVDRWLDRHGAAVAFFSRLLPGVRSFSSLLIGASTVRFYTFVVYTFVGSFLWNLPLAYVGYAFGDYSDVLRPYFHIFEIIVVIAIVLAIGLFIWKHTSPRMEHNA